MAWESEGKRRNSRQRRFCSVSMISFHARPASGSLAMQGVLHLKGGTVESRVAISSKRQRSKSSAWDSLVQFFDRSRARRRSKRPAIKSVRGMCVEGNCNRQERERRSDPKVEEGPEEGVCFTIGMITGCELGNFGIEEERQQEKELHFFPLLHFARREAEEFARESAILHVAPSNTFAVIKLKTAALNVR